MIGIDSMRAESGEHSVEKAEFVRMPTGDRAGFTIKPVGDQAALVCFEQRIDPDINARAAALGQAVMDAGILGVLETVPAFCSLLVRYDCLVTDFERVAGAVQNLAAAFGKQSRKAGKIVEIPVCYGGKYGEDLPFVAAHAGLSEAEVVRIHASRPYRIYMIGFLPGFPYLGGLDERLFTPRLSSPRTKIPEGSVGIGGEQTGIYPMESPGGWQLIGRTPLLLHRADLKLPYQAGDEIQFVPITEREFEAIYQKAREFGESDRKERATGWG